MAHFSRHLTIDSDRQGRRGKRLLDSLCCILFYFKRNWGKLVFVCLVQASGKLVLWHLCPSSSFPVDFPVLPSYPAPSHLGLAALFLSPSLCSQTFCILVWPFLTPLVLSYCHRIRLLTSASSSGASPHHQPLHLLITRTSQRLSTCEMVMTGTSCLRLQIDLNSPLILLDVVVLN